MSTWDYNKFYKNWIRGNYGFFVLDMVLATLNIVVAIVEHTWPLNTINLLVALFLLILSIRILVHDIPKVRRRWRETDVIMKSFDEQINRLEKELQS